MTRITTEEARDRLAEIVRRAAHEKERILLTDSGETLAAVISLQDLELLEELEDRADVEAANKALEESDERIPYGVVRQNLGLDGALPS